MKGTSLCLVLLMILMLSVLTSGKPQNHKKKRRGRHLTNKASSESHIPRSRRKKSAVKPREEHPLNRGQRKRSKHKEAKKKNPKARKRKTLSDDPSLDQNINQTVSQRVESALEENISPTDHLADVLPGWLPHVARRKCGKCVWQECPTVQAMRKHCPSGLVRDQCNCCPQCANGVGMPCYLPNTFSPIWLPSCGDDLECIPVYTGNDLDGRSEETWGTRGKSEGICSCKDRTPVCGTNNATYDNICEFREASARISIYTNTTVTILHRGPCSTAPKIDSPPLDAVAPIGNVVSFRCETSGFPQPRVQWFKRTDENSEINEEELPGYLNHAVTQMRGGPGKYQLTTWLTLDKVKSSDTGSYICRSSNNFGTVDQSAALTITQP